MGCLLEAFCLLLVLEVCLCDDILCDRRPLNTKTEPLPPDNRFKIDIIGVTEKYLPTKLYTVRLYATDNSSTFIAFTIWASGDSKPDDKNSKKKTHLLPGLVYPYTNSDTTFNPKCANSVIQSDLTPKKSVEVFWRAPPKENECVTLNAVVAVKQDVWYKQDEPLSKRVCEDHRNVLDMQPTVNDHCQATEDARYLLTFEGMWSFNTHHLMFPNSTDLARFSDVVGASHSKQNFSVYRYNSEATEGLRRLAEQGNTTKLELEILKKLGSAVRTLIKASAPPKPNMETTAMFRVTREHHLVSVVTAIIPSPDWFLGVANMELCEIKTNTWAHNLTLNLYPMDAGTDSGLWFESPNEDTMPPQPISRVDFNIPKEQIRPFARVHFDLIRTYYVPSYKASTEEVVTEEESTGEETETSPTQEPAETGNEITGQVSDPDCPMTTWEEWLPCGGDCVDGKVEGFHTRFRYHIVDDVPVEKYGPSNKRVSKECFKKYSVSESEPCEDTCEEEEVEAQRRIW